METNSNQKNDLPISSAPIPNFCPTCHQPVLPQYYFCPNCGTKLNLPPLSTVLSAQLKLYAFSIILPMICFIFVGKWPGTKYYKSTDPKTKQVGLIAWTLLILSTIITIWSIVIWTQNTIRSSVNSINTDMGSF